MANTSVGNLSLSISSSVTKSVNAINKLTASLQFANAELAKMNALTANSPVTININKINNGVKKLEEQSKKTTKAVQTMSGSLASLKDTFMFNIGFGSLQQGIRTVTNLFTQGFNEASEFVENFNLFNVSMRGSTEEAMKYQNKLNNSMKVNMSESMRYQGFFKNLANSLGITNDASTLLSENLTNLTYDLSSLYNVDFNTMYSKLQSGIVGQTKPLRSVGIDVTQQTLQPLLYEMGINKYVTELTQAEKVLLRYISILKQSESAHGDFARTIETPSNQIRIFNDQIKELQRWFGAVFIGTIGKILPYINAFVIALKEVFKWVALAFGFNVSDYDFLAEQDDMASGLADSIDGALASNEKLRKSLAGFDEINNIAQESSGSAMPNIGLSDSYFALLDELKGYDNLMSGVKTKAGEIADNILSWLGFTKVVNKETGEINYVLENANIFAWGIVGAFTALASTAILGTIANIGKLFGITSGVGIISSAVSGVIALFDGLLLYFGQVALGFGNITGIFATSSAGFLATGALVVAGVIGFVGAIVGALVDFYNKSEEFRTNVSKAIEGVKNVFKSFYDAVSPYIDDIKQNFIRLWEFAIKPLWDGWVDFVGSVANLMLELWITVEPLVSWLASLFGDVLGIAISNLFDAFVDIAILVGTVVGGAFSGVARVIEGVSNIISWLRDRMIEFKTTWDNVWSNIGKGFADFFKPVTDFFNGFVTWFANKINDLIRVYNAIPILGDVGLVNMPSSNNVPKGTPSQTKPINNGGASKNLPSISMYADGGFPTSGQMFIAREGGAEMVGSIGGRTSVANNDQIVEAVSQGVAQAVSSVMNSNGQTTVNLIINDDVFGRAVIKSANKTMKNTNLVLEI